VDIAERYKQAIDVIRVHYDGEIRPFFTVEFGRKKKQGAISIVIEYSKGINPHRLIESLREELRDENIVFLGNDRWLGEEKYLGVEIVVAQSNSQFDALRLAESRGVNQDISTEDVIRKLKEYDERYGVEILKATIETVEFRLSKLPEDINEYLDDQSKTMKVDTTLREEIISQLREHQIDGFWWD
jgi:hypothetical protein